MSKISRHASAFLAREPDNKSLHTFISNMTLESNYKSKKRPSMISIDDESKAADAPTGVTSFQRTNLNKINTSTTKTASASEIVQMLKKNKIDVL